jgi:putative ABC transport system permease protein
MIFLRTWRLGLKSLLLHPLRSLLTMLGIFIGVASVIWLLAIGQGISKEAQRQIEGLGADNIIVRSVKPPTETTGSGRGPTPYGLTRAEYDLLTSTIPTVKRALPIREMKRQFKFLDREADGRLVGCTPEYADVTQLVVNRGRFISDADVRDRLNNCVLAEQVAETLFNFEDPIGRKIFLPEHKDYYEIVGVLKHREATAAVGGSLAGQDFSKDVYIPITTMRQRIGDTVFTSRSGTFEGEIIELNQITLRINSVDDVPLTADLVRDTLRMNHKIRDPNEPAAEPDPADLGKLEDIALVVPYDLLERAKATKIMFMVFMGLIAAISLLVGGIGIMNIMLATVTERTREIGIRRALGANRTHIVTQFLVETISLCVMGGLFGILAGVICPLVVKWMREAAQKFATEWFDTLPDVVKTLSPEVVFMSIPLAFGIAVIVGIVFGIYPAIRAAMMDPIEALRHE